MKSPRQKIHPSAPAEELYGLPPPYSWNDPPQPGPSRPYPGASMGPGPGIPRGPGPSFGRAPIGPTPPVLPPVRFPSSDQHEDIPMQTEPGNVARFQLKAGKQRKKHNPQLYTKRGCTDVICCFLFLVFAAGWAVVAVIGFMGGDPERLIFPTDSNGRRCGSERPGSYNYTDRPLLFYFDITKCISYATVLGGCQTPQVCVDKCPDGYFSYMELQPRFRPQNFKETVLNNLICLDYVNKNDINNFDQINTLVSNRQCTAYTVKSVPVLGRCIPQAIVGAVEVVDAVQKGQNMSLDLLSQKFGDDPYVPADKGIKDSQQFVGHVIESEDVVTKIVHDLSKTWWQVLALIALSGILAFLWTVIMRVLGSLMIWLSILILFAGLSAGSFYSWMRWNSLKSSGAIDDFSFQPVFSLYFEMPTTWLVIAITISVVLVILLLIIIYVRQRISIAVALIKESSRAVGNMMSTLFFPLFPFILHLLVFVVWGSIAIWLASSGQENCMTTVSVGVNATSQKCDCSENNPNCVYVNMTKNDDLIFWLQFYNLFAFFWVSCFVTALGDIALAGAFASHYWAMNKSKDLPSFPVLRALARAVRYNMGSLAFGSLIIALVKMVRVILEYIEEKANKSNNSCVKIFFTALKCCFWCLEVFLKFLTKNAFIMMAIYGRPFFTSAKDSFLLLTRNIVRTVVVNKVAGILLFIGKAMITIGMGVVAFFYFSGQWVINGIPTVDLYYYFVPIIIVLIGSYFMADLFFDVYEMAVDTTFICFLEDSEQNDGSTEKPFYMSRELQEILGKKNETYRK